MPKSFRRATFILGLLLSGYAGRSPAEAQEPPRAAPTPASVSWSIEEGDLNGARYAIAHPITRAWNHRLLLLAHGFRPDQAPLIPDLHPEHLAAKTLLEEGWMVATTSYRRNGTIVADAIADLDALRTHIGQTYGEPEQTLLMGDFLGGLIVAIMAERDPDLYSGAIAFSASLSAQEPNMKVGLSLLPRIPLLFVANQAGLAGPKAYVKADLIRPDPIVPPALFVLSRDGNVAANERERLAAVRALIAWIDHGPNALPRPAENAPFYDLTIPPEPGPSTAIPRPDRRGFETAVAEVSAIYGHAVLEAEAGDFAAAGIKPMMFFQLLSGGQTFRVLYGRDLRKTKRGDWVAFPDAEGHTVIVRNGESAVDDAHLAAGERLEILRYEGPVSPAPK